MNKFTLDDIKDALYLMKSYKKPYICLDYRQIKDIINDIYDICLERDYDLYRQYSGITIFKCNKCYYWHDVLVLVDVFECKSCGEINTLDFDDISNFMRQNICQNVDYRPTHTVYIFNTNREESKEYTSDFHKIYKIYEIYEMNSILDNPSRLVDNNTILVDYLFWYNNISKLEDIPNLFYYSTQCVYLGSQLRREF